MRVIFVGSSSFGMRCLGAITRLPGISVVGVITNPKTFGISYSEKPVTNLLHADFIEWSVAHTVPCYEMQSNMREPALEGWVRSLEPRLFVVVGWYHLLPKSLRDVAPAVGLHASLLPDYCGGAPLVWAMINGETRTGITLFELADGVDDGDVYGQRSEAIRDDDTIATLYRRIEGHGIDLLGDVLPRIAAGDIAPRPQPIIGRRVFPQRSPEDGQICWNKSAAEIDRFVRAQTKPYPGAFTTLDGVRMTIWSSRVVESNDLSDPGKIERSGASYLVGCASGKLELVTVSFAGDEYSNSRMSGLLIDGGQLLAS